LRFLPAFVRLPPKHTRAGATLCLRARDVLTPIAAAASDMRVCVDAVMQSRNTVDALSTALTHLIRLAGRTGGLLTAATEHITDTASPPADTDRGIQRRLQACQVDVIISLFGSADGESADDALATAATVADDVSTKTSISASLEGIASTTHLSSVRLPYTAYNWSGIAGYAAVRQTLSDAIITPIRAAMAGALAGTAESTLLDTMANGPQLLQLAQAMVRMHVAPPGGLLLEGPSGTGKTAMACALAQAAGLRFIHIQCPQLLSRYVGDSEAAVRQVFATARACAPCLLLLDDIDAIGRARAGLGGQTHRIPDAAAGTDAGDAAGHSNSAPSAVALNVLDRVLSTLLNEMDGVGHKGSGSGPDSASPATTSSVASSLAALSFADDDFLRRRKALSERCAALLSRYVLVTGTTSLMSTLDSALVRPGRLDRRVKLDYPSGQDRVEILRNATRNMALAPDLDLNAVASHTVFSHKTPAELQGLCSAAALRALQEAVRKTDPDFADPDSEISMSSSNLEGLEASGSASIEIGRRHFTEFFMFG
jgi:SpoVK/Ycf46/Vps4 family AAA+-type ATPase